MKKSWIAIGFAIVLFSMAVSYSNLWMGAGGVFCMILAVSFAYQAGQRRTILPETQMLEGWLQANPTGQPYRVVVFRNKSIPDIPHLRPVILVSAEFGVDDVLILLSKDLDRMNLRQLIEKVNFEIKRMV